MTTDAAKAEKTGKWTDAEVETVKEGYDPAASDASVAALREVTGRSKRSIIGKLVAEKVYVTPEKKPPAPKDMGPTKGEILKGISDNGFNVDGFEGSTKDALKRLAMLVGTSD